MERVHNSLADLLDRVVFMPQDFSMSRTPAVSMRVNAYCERATNVDPAAEAASFYLCNDFIARLRQRFHPNEELPAGIQALVDLAVRDLTQSSLRLAYYTLLIITREARHACTGVRLDSVYESIDNAAFIDFHRALRSKNSSTAVVHFFNSPPDILVKDYVRGIDFVFSEAHFHSKYGGAPWADISSTLLKLFCGVTSLEVFADTAFTLAHNGGPMFNKGMLYTAQDVHKMYLVLDVQRAGQIPRLVASNASFKSVFSKYSGFFNLVGQEYTAPIDWDAVQAAGAVQNYTAMQKQKKQKAPTINSDGYLMTFPGYFVKKLPREQA